MSQSLHIDTNSIADAMRDDLFSAESARFRQIPLTRGHHIKQGTLALVHTVYHFACALFYALAYAVTRRRDFRPDMGRHASLGKDRLMASLIHAYGLFKPVEAHTMLQNRRLERPEFQAP